MIEGIYALQEWLIDGETFSSPQVAGRFVLAEGAAIAILHNRIDPKNASSATLFGHYRLAVNTFSYAYDDASTLTQIDGKIVHNEQVPWHGLREFAVARINHSVRVYSSGGNEEFIFSSEGFTYSEKGSVLRRWSRIKSA